MAECLVEQIPVDYPTTPILPRAYRQRFKELLYETNWSLRADMPGNLVESGISIERGRLMFLLTNENQCVERHHLGFYSFEVFPGTVAEDSGTHPDKGYFAISPRIMRQVLPTSGSRITAWLPTNSTLSGASSLRP